jgi:hypothetical protein
MAAARLTHTAFLAALRAIAEPGQIPGIAKFFSPDPDHG